MKKYFGIILIVLTFLLTWIFWCFEALSKPVFGYRGYSQLIASIGLITFTWIFYISTRHRLMDKIFYGLDKSYVYHKYLSIMAIVLIWVHNFTVKMGRSSVGEGISKQKFTGTGNPPQGFKRPEGLGEGGGAGFFGIHISGREFASPSLYIFTGLVILFLITYKLNYERWKLIHKLILVPYVFGLIHYYSSSEYGPLTLSAFSIWMSLFNIIGILAALYSIFLYEITAFKYQYKVSSLKEVAKETLEITGITSGKSMQFKPGQFAFIKVLGRNKDFPSHPFTINQAYKPGEIQFAIKALGDHTGKLKDNLAIGDTIAVSGPFGRFNYKTGSKHQIWVAGGIGITPFRSFWQTEISQDFSIDLFYAYNSEQDGAYVDELRAMEARNNLRVHLFDSSKTGFLGIKDFEEHVSKDKLLDVYFCGPKPMRIKIRKDLKKAGYKIKEFHYEFFQFK